jgi:hypothetical protein
MPPVLALHPGESVDDKVPDVPQPQEAEKRLMAGKKGVGASAPTQINVVNVEALVVGPDDVLLIRLPLDLSDEATDMLATVWDEESP